MVQSQLGHHPVASFGVCRVVKRPFVIDVSEYHDTCCELVLPQDGDVLMHVAPGGARRRSFPSTRPRSSSFRRGPICCLRPGVWHHAPYAFGTEVVNCLVVLPERTYKNDCTVYQFPARKVVQVMAKASAAVES